MTFLQYELENARHRSLEGYSPLGHKEPGTTEATWDAGMENWWSLWSSEIMTYRIQKSAVNECESRSVVSDSVVSDSIQSMELSRPEYWSG